MLVIETRISRLEVGRLLHWATWATMLQVSVDLTASASLQWGDPSMYTVYKNRALPNELQERSLLSDSNRLPYAYKAYALPGELSRQKLPESGSNRRPHD
jgi:hypothetical protein